MDQFPQMLYVHPGSQEMHGSTFDTRIVASAEELEAAKAEGWSESTDEAKATHAAKKAAAAEEAIRKADELAAAQDAAPPNREELEQKATDLGIRFDGRTSDKKLNDLIKAALED